MSTRLRQLNKKERKKKIGRTISNKLNVEL
jgi:hypothetical protein